MRAAGFWSRVGRALRGLLAVAVVFGMGFGAGYGVFWYRSMHGDAVEAGPAPGDLRLPGEVEKRVVTVDEVSAKLKEIGQLAVYMGEYTVEKSVEPTVDNQSGKIYIALPAAAVLDNYVIWDSVECTESNNLLNPIDFAQYQVLIEEIEQDGLAKVEAEGIYDAARENAKRVVRNFLAGFDGFEVVFVG